MNIKIEITAKELERSLTDLGKAIFTLAEVLEKNTTPDEGFHVGPVPEEPKTEEVKTEEVKTEDTPKITLEVVRAKLAALSQSGKQSEVKALIKKFGAAKLTEIPKDKFPEILKEAEKIA